MRPAEHAADRLGSHGRAVAGSGLYVMIACGSNSGVRSLQRARRAAASALTSALTPSRPRESIFARCNAPRWPPQHPPRSPLRVRQPCWRCCCSHSTSPPPPPTGLVVPRAASTCKGRAAASLTPALSTDTRRHARRARADPAMPCRASCSPLLPGAGARSPTTPPRPLCRPRLSTACVQAPHSSGVVVGHALASPP